MVITITMRNVRLRNEIYEFRMAVPKDCQKSLDDKTEITKSLKTKDQAEAAVLARKETDEWKLKFKDIRNAGKTPIPSPSNTAPDIVAEFREKLTAHMEQHLPTFLGKQSDKELKDSAEFYLECLFIVRNNNPAGGFDLLDELGISFPLPEQKTPGITRKLNKVLIDLLHELRIAVDKELGFEFSKELEADLLDQEPSATIPFSGNGHLHKSAALSQQSKSHSPSSEKTPPTVAEVLKECLDFKQRAFKTEESITTEVASLLEWLKLDADSTPIESILTNNLIDYRDKCLKQLPKNANRMTETKNLTVPEQVSYGKKHGGERIGITTINNRITSLGILFNYARKKHYVPFAVTEGLLLENPRRQEKLSGAIFDGYSNDQMSELMKYQKEHRTEHKTGLEWKYWIPMILAYTGCRANEIAMLTVNDIKTDEDGIMYFNLRNDAKLHQRVKNAMSVRKVPICQKLIDLGFVEYVDSVKDKVSPRKNKDGRLWPCLTYCKHNKWLRKPSYYFNKKVRPDIGAEDVKSGFHGLRSSVCRALQRKKEDQRVIDELTGHMPSGISQISLGYQGRLELKDLKAAIDKLDWENYQ